MHALLSQQSATELTKGLRVLIDERPEVQILWKLEKDKDFDGSATLPLQTNIKSGRVRLTKWIKADIVAIL